MNRYRALLLGSLLLGPCVAMATSQSLNEFTPKVLPVLVQVDSHGKVTDVSPSIELAPRFDRLLRETLDQLITGPANEHGHPVSSQFVMNLALRTTPRPDGKFDTGFAYVSTSPVPPGSWFWVHEDGHRLALMNRLDRRARNHYFPDERHWANHPLPWDARTPYLTARSASRPSPQPVSTPRSGPSGH